MIIIEANRVAEFTGSATSLKMINPIEVKSPSGNFVLNENVLKDVDIMEAFPGLAELPKSNEVVYFEYDEEGNKLIS
jgi:hypothetical protein